MPSPWSEEERVLGQGLGIWEGGLWDATAFSALPCRKTLSGSSFPLGNTLSNSWTIGSNVASLFFPALCEVSVQLATGSWRLAQAATGGPHGHWEIVPSRLGKKSLPSACTHVHLPVLRLASSLRGFSESITCLRSEHRRPQSGEGVAGLDLDPPGAHSPAPAHPRPWQLYYLCSFDSLSLLPSIAAKRMRLTKERHQKGEPKNSV